MRFVFVTAAVTAMGISCAFADDAGSSKLEGDTLKKAVSGKTVHLGHTARHAADPVSHERHYVGDRR
jgi:hypothetical protein